ncbi:MAG TPA: 50S ribosomal protein L24 [Candidatus Altiarchaeales archaeon]|nr:50S ribosomal protein L24 [Candidatus Altiarchaeales archaeon]
MKKPSSKKPRKQRKWRLNAPMHRRRKMICSPLTKELREKYNRRNIPVRKGDRVKILRGEFRGTTGEVTRVSLRDYKIYIDGITAKKADGTGIERSVDPSNVMITEIFMEDKGRRAMLERNVK